MTATVQPGASVADLKNFVNGEYVTAAAGRTSEVVDPSTGEAYALAPVSGPQDVDAALRSAEAAREAWRDATPAQRSLALLKIADAVEERAADLVEAECRNTGKPVALTLAEELPPCVDELRFFAGAARILQGSAAGEYMAGHTSMVRREPIGVCAQVTPWNYPLMMAIWKIAPALAAGNTVVLKPSDTTPVSTLMLAEIAAGYPAARRAQRGLRQRRTPAGRWSATTSRRWCRSPGRSGPASRWPRPRRPGSSGSTSSWAGRRRWWSSTTRTWRRPRRASPGPATSTPARTAPRRRGCWPARGSPPT